MNRENKFLEGGVVESKSDKKLMASFLTKPKTKSETSSSTLNVQLKEIPNEDVGQDETLSTFLKTCSPYSSHDFRISLASAT
jgi:hypothetical protein